MMQTHSKRKTNDNQSKRKASPDLFLKNKKQPYTGNTYFGFIEHYELSSSTIKVFEEAKRKYLLFIIYTYFLFIVPKLPKFELIKLKLCHFNPKFQRRSSQNGQNSS